MDLFWVNFFTTELGCNLQSYRVHHDDFNYCNQMAFIKEDVHFGLCFTMRRALRSIMSSCCSSNQRSGGQPEARVPGLVSSLATKWLRYGCEVATKSYEVATKWLRNGCEMAAARSEGIGLTSNLSQIGSDPEPI